MAQHNEFGQWGEELAERFLIDEGYFVRHRDWHFGHRDIDLVATDKDGTLVFVEVKTRRSTDFSTPEESVDQKKIYNLAAAAAAYIKTFQVDVPVRFDVITIVGDGVYEAKITHYPNAFLPPTNYERP